MDGANLNGGNADVARAEGPNLEPVAAMPDTLEQHGEHPEHHGEHGDVEHRSLEVEIKLEQTEELNGDLSQSPRKSSPTNVRRKLRKFKANSTSTIETTDVSLPARGIKRKLSEPDDVSSEDSTEFNGFDAQGATEMEPGSHVLKKLIAEAEVAEAQLAKRFKFTTFKGGFDGRDGKEEDGDSDENRILIYDKEHGFDVEKIKKERDTDESETDSTGLPNTDLELSGIKTEETSVKSASSAASSPAMPQKSKSSRVSRGASPAVSASKQKAAVDMTNPAYKEPFKYGWKRELVFRASSDTIKRMADIYYYTPKGKKVRSFREVAEFLHTKELTIDNFTFFKEPIGIDDPEKEIIRDAKRIRSSTSNTPQRKSFPHKKIMPSRRVAEEAPAPALAPAPSPAAPTPVASPAAAASAKTSAKSPKMAASGFKVKVPAKKTPQIKIKSAEESDMHPPQRATASTRRSQQQAIEKPQQQAKPKRLATPKVQEPCSIRCSTSMGLIPSLQCRVCLCLYHPECVDGLEFAGSDDYVCKNCQQDTAEPQAQQAQSQQQQPQQQPQQQQQQPQQQQQQPQQQPVNPKPPPLIPISMLGAQTAKSKQHHHQAGLTSPPKLQRIPKTSEGPSSENVSQTTRTTPTTTTSTTTATTTTLGGGTGAGQKVQKPCPGQDRRPEAACWYPQSENDFLQSSPDGTVPRPAQNIAVMAGKRYIVVPKNNAMAVQPAITVKPDKIGDKPPSLLQQQDASLMDISNTVDTAALAKSRHHPAPASLRLGPKEDSLARETAVDHARPGCSPTVTDHHQNAEAVANTEDRNSYSIDVQSSGRLEPGQEANAGTAMAVNDEQKQRDHDDRISDSNSGTVRISSKRKQNQAEPAEPQHQQQHFMDSVCAGYHALLRIFQYLKVQELLRAARVCKMWRDLAAHPSLWKTVRMKNSQVTDWDGLADTLQRHGTQHLDLRKMLVAGESDGIWRKFLSVIPRVTSLVKLELCRCPVMVVEEVIKSCPQLEVLSAMSIKCDTLNLQSVGNLKRCQELRLKAISGMSLQEDLTPLQQLTQLTQLSLTSVKELGKKKIDIIQALVNLETLELGECSDFPDKFGTTVLIKLQKLERLRLEKGQGSCCTFDILEGVSKLQSLSQMELVNFDVKNGFDKCLANCKNIKRLLIIPTYISQSATSNNMVLGGVTELSNNLTHFVWGVTLELLRVTELFVDQCNLMNKHVTGDSIPVLKPVPCLKLIEDVDDENDNQKGEDKQQPNLTNPQVDILPLPQLQKLLLTALPKTRVKILKIPFHATWRQSISDTATQ